METKEIKNLLSNRMHEAFVSLGYSIKYRDLMCKKNNFIIYGFSPICTVFKNEGVNIGISCRAYSEEFTKWFRLKIDDPDALPALWGGDFGVVIGQNFNRIAIYISDDISKIDEAIAYLNDKIRDNISLIEDKFLEFESLYEIAIASIDNKDRQDITPWATIQRRDEFIEWFSKNRQLQLR
jgi:hypothetical protein